MELEPRPRTLSADQLLAGVHQVEQGLVEIDVVLDREHEGITLLRARYLAALLARIEAGDPDASLLDRFERVAGFSPETLGVPA